MSDAAPLVTPDGRYVVVRGRLWRRAKPTLTTDERQALVNELMAARRAVRLAAEAQEMQEARKAVDRAKRGLGERGPVWWDDKEPDLTRRLAKNTKYAEWFAAQEAGDLSVT